MMKCISFNMGARHTARMSDSNNKGKCYMMAFTLIMTNEYVPHTDNKLNFKITSRAELKSRVN